MATSDPAVDSGVSCPECNAPVRPDGVEHVCTDCGLVVGEDAIDHGPEWRAFDAGDRDEKVRAEPTNADLYDGGLGSEVGFASERDRRTQRLQTRQRRAKWSRENRTRLYAGGEITRISEALEVGKDLEKQAGRLFRQLHEKGLCVGRDLDTVAATCVYTICRVHQRGVTPGEVAAVARTEERWIARRHTWLCDELGVECPPPSVDQRARVVANAVDVPDETLDALLDALDDLPESERYRGSPSVLAAALLWDVGPDDVTQREVSEAAGVTPTAMRQRLRRLDRRMEA